MKHVLVAMIVLLSFACKKEKTEETKTDDIIYKVTCDSCYVWYTDTAKSTDSLIVQKSWEYHFTQPKGNNEKLLTLGAWEKSKTRKVEVSMSIYHGGELVQQYNDNNLTDSVKPPLSIFYVFPKK